MQIRPALSLLVLALLYWAPAPLAIRQAAAQQEQQEQAPIEDDHVLAARAHVAVILPLQSQSFGRHADSVRLGVFAAAGLQTDRLPVIVYATTEEPDRVLEAYQRAVSTGATAVIGPLTRNGVSALAASGQVAVPTLALNTPDTDVRLKLVSALARSSGLGGMVGGQMLDLAVEGRFDASPPALGEADVKTLQAMKTGALLRFGCVAGAILGQAGPGKMHALDRYGATLGEAFQIADDLLDLEGDPAKVGKATGKDAAAHKATLVSVLGPATARRRLESLVAEAQAALGPFGANADILRAAARFVAQRQA